MNTCERQPVHTLGSKRSCGAAAGCMSLLAVLHDARGPELPTNHNADASLQLIRPAIRAWRNILPGRRSAERGLVYQCNRVMLLYPHHQGLPSEPVCKPYDIASPKGADCLFVSTVDVSGTHSSVAAALIATVQKCLESSYEMTGCQCMHTWRTLRSVKRAAKSGWRVLIAT